jgi:hypothetical protein
MIFPLKIALLNASSDFHMMSVDSSNWMAKKIDLFTVSIHLWLGFLGNDLYTLTRSVIWHQDSENIFFVFLTKYLQFDSMVVKLLNDKLWVHVFCHDFGNRIACFFGFVRNICNFGPLFSLAYMICYKPFKIIIWFLADMWGLCVKVSSQLTWNNSS